MLLSAMVDLRLHDGGKYAEASSVGQVVDLDVWVIVTGNNGTVTDEGLQSLQGSFLSTDFGGGVARGTLVATRDPSFSDMGSSDGAAADLDGDGDRDVGSNNDSVADGFFIGRSNNMRPDGIVDGISKSFRVATLTFTVESLLGGTQTEIEFRRRDRLETALWLEDGTPRDAFRGNLDVGAPVVLWRPESPVTVRFNTPQQHVREDAGLVSVIAELHSPLSKDVTVPFTVSGTASDSADYTIAPSPIVIPAGSRTGSAILSINDDPSRESDETVIVTMGTPVNATAGRITVQTITIVDNDPTPTVQFTSASQSVPENVGTLTISAELSWPTYQDVTIPISVSGTASKGSDYYGAILSEPIFIPAGSISGSITATVVDDAMDEPDETVVVTMGTPTNAFLGTTTIHTVTINVDDDPAPTVGFQYTSQRTLSETGMMTMTALLSVVSAFDVVVPFTVTGTATAGLDYSIPFGSFTILAGSLGKNMTITIELDSVYEGNETVVVTMGAPTNATLGSITVYTLTITDDEPPPTVQFTQASQAANETSGSMTVRVQLSTASGRDTIVPFSVSGTATISADCTITPSPITIPAGSLVGTITIGIVDDILPEADETVVIIMGPPTGATLGGMTTHTATILDNDTPTVQFTSASQIDAENAGTMVIAAQLAWATISNTVIPFTVAGTATSGADYTITPSPITIKAGSTTGTIIITLIDDTEGELDETVIVTMGTPIGAIASGVTVHTATIIDNEPITNYALSFDGYDDYVRLGDPPDNHLDIGSNATIEAWVKFNTLPENNFYTLVSKDSGGGSEKKWIFAYARNSGGISNATVFHINGPSGESWVQSTNWTPEINRWYHLAVVKKSDYYTFYRDGVADGSASSSVAVADVAFPLYLGQSEGLFCIHGQLDEVRMWNVARTADQIRTTMNTTLVGDEPGLVGCWNFNRGVYSQTVVDASPFRNDGTLGADGRPEPNDPRWAISTVPIPALGLPVQFTSASQSGGEGIGIMAITAKLCAPIDKDVTVPFTLTGTATQGGDYTITSTPITIPAGSISSTITITVLNDNLYEVAETIIVTMGTPTNAIAAGGTIHTATITDDDPAPTVEFTSASQTVSEDAGTTAITARLSTVSGADVTVPFKLGGTAKANTDYSITSGAIIIPSGSTTGSITVTIINDALNEFDETAVITLTVPTNAVLGATAVYVLTIQDDDPLPTARFKVANQDTDEYAGTISITVQLSTASGKGVTIPFTVTGTASGGVDYAISSSPLLIPPGSVTTAMTINVIQDLLIEPDETVVVTLGPATNAVIDANNVCTLTIKDDDAPGEYALTFDGVNDYVNLGDPPDNHLELATNATIETWVRFDTRPIYCHPLVNKSAGSAGWMLAYGHQPGTSTYTTYFNVIRDNVGYSVLSNPWNPVLGRWYHLVAVKNGSTYTFFRDGVADGSGSIAADVADVGGEVLLGTNADRRFCLDGQLDEVRMWNVARSGDEIRSAKNTLLTGNEPGLVGYWNFNEALHEPMVRDLSPFGNPGILNGPGRVLSTAPLPGPTVQFTSSSQSFSEGIGSMTITAELSAITYGNVTIPFTVTGTATDSIDYTVTPSPLTIKAGSRSATVTITVVDDPLPESSETVIVTMGTPTNATASGATVHTVTIVDNDPVPTVEFTSANQSAGENAGTITLVVQLSAVSGADITVPFTIGGTTTPDVDYNITASPIIIPAGLTTGSIVIAVTDDSLYEPTEAVVVSLGTPTNATLGTTAAHTLTILDNDLPPAVQFAVASQGVGEGVGTINVTAQLSAVSGMDVTVPVSVAGTASGGLDYTIASGPLIIPAGQAAGTVAVAVLQDVLHETAETVILTLGTPTNAVIGAVTTHTLTIIDDDPLPVVQFSVAAQSVAEVVQAVAITAYLSAIAGTDVTVPVAVTGTATTVVDYTITPGPIIIPAGFTTGTVTVTVAHDMLHEANEAVILTLGTPTDAVLGTITTHTVTIIDDDPPPIVQFTAASQSVAENAGTAIVTAQLSVVAGLDVTLPFTLSGTAVSGADYTITPSPITIPAGSTTGSIAVALNDELGFEADETLVITMGTPFGAVGSGNTAHTMVITDDDLIYAIVPSVQIPSSSTQVVSGYVDITFDVPPNRAAMLAGYSMQLSLNPPGSGVRFTGVGEPGNPIFPGSNGTFVGTGDTLMASDNLPGIGQANPIISGKGLIRVFYEVQPRARGTFQVRFDNLELFDANVEAIAGIRLVTGQIDVVDITPPAVASVRVGGMAWTALFPHGSGYLVPAGASQLAPLPWGNLNKISITFTEEVAVHQQDLVLRGVNSPVYAISNFSYDPVSNTAVWTLGNAIAKDKLCIVLSDEVSDLAGNQLDGDWTDTVSSFPSGDGAAGGGFAFRLNVLPGDANRGGSVGVDDVLYVRNAQFTSPGNPDYSASYDMNANGSIAINDVLLVRNQQFTSLPAGDPLAAGQSPTPLPSPESNSLTATVQSPSLTGSLDSTVSGFVDVLLSVPPGLAPKLAGYETRVLLSAIGSGLTLTGAGAANNPVFPGQMPAVFNATATRFDVTDALMGVGQETAISDGAGLFRIKFDVAPGTYGTFQISLSGLHLYDGNVRAIEVGTVLAGEITIVSPHVQPILQGTGTFDAFRLALDSAGQTLRVWLNADPPTEPVHSYSLASFDTVVIRGNGGQDTLMLDAANGDPLGSAKLQIETGSIAADGSGTVLRIGGLRVASDATLDLVDHTLVIASADLDAISALVKSGRNQGNWQGPGLQSSAAANNPGKFTGLAVLLNDKGNGAPFYKTFAGEAVDANCILVKYTWKGDANLDGVVNADDYFQIDSGYITQAKGYQNGDFNYDGVINADDYFLIDSAFIGQSGPLAASKPQSAVLADVAVQQKAKKAEPDGILSQLFSTEPVL
ncbi:MAG: hypothetical protein NTU53_16405 [Planctomycetota bacterium]|nr:hypothetical protein [Planctomycetota bacterium]